MGDLRQGTIRPHDRMPPAASLSYGAPCISGMAADGERETSGFLDEFYAAAVEDSRLSTALKQFAFAFDAGEACLFNADPSPPRDQVTFVERSPSPEDGVSHREGAASATGLSLAQELGADLAAGQSDVWLGTVRGIGAEVRALHAQTRQTHYLAIAPRSDGDPAIGIVALRDSPFTAEDLASARSLLPDVRRALKLRRQAGRVEALGLGVQLFDRNPVAIFITRQRAVERSNAAATVLLAAGRPVNVVAGRLHFEDSRVHTAFELISRADAHAQGNQAFAFVVEGSDGDTWIAQLSPMRSTSRFSAGSGATSPGVVVALTPFNAASQTRGAMLNGFTDLTPTERTIFAAFVDGQDIAAIAARLNRSVETVRWHVRNLFTKLGVNSQADLARLGALLLPI